MAKELQAGYRCAEGNPEWFGEKISARQQFFSNAVMSILQICLRLSHGATQHTLEKQNTQVVQQGGKIQIYCLNHVSGHKK